MPKLIKNECVVDDNWQVLQESETLIEGNIIVPLQAWLEHKDTLKTRTAVGVWLNSDQPPTVLADDLAHIQVIAINFPTFMDGRGFSYARELRERYGYTGEIRAIGLFIRDQLYYLKRCGFDAFALTTSDPETAIASLQDFSEGYQAAIDQPLPLFARRH